MKFLNAFVLAICFAAGSGCSLSVSDSNPVASTISEAKIVGDTLELSGEGLASIQSIRLSQSSNVYPLTITSRDARKVIGLFPAGSILTAAAAVLTVEVAGADTTTSNLTVSMANFVATNVRLSGSLGIGTTSPATKVQVSGDGAILRITNTDPNVDVLTRTMSGIELSGRENTNLRIGPAIKFMSHDTSFTTENPKFLAAITSRATQAYTTDTRGGRALDFWTTPNTPGASTLPRFRMTINEDGYVGIGTSQPAVELQVAGDIAPATNGGGDLGSGSLRFDFIYSNNALNTVSDMRLKKDILPSDLGLDFIGRLRAVSYRWKKNKDSRLHYGLIAQETDRAIRDSKAEAGAPAAANDYSIVQHDAVSDRYSLTYTELIAPLIRAVQELNKKCESADTRSARLENENRALKAYLCGRDPKAEFCAGRN